jgi:hypothetical protein
LSTAPPGLKHFLDARNFLLQIHFANFALLKESAQDTLTGGQTMRKKKKTHEKRKKHVGVDVKYQKT